MPPNNNPVSKDQAILIGNLINTIPVLAGSTTSGRGFALQSAKQADVGEFVTGWAVDHATVTLGSDIISSLMDEKKGNGPKPVAVAVAGWLDGLVARGVGAEMTEAWRAGRAGFVGTNTVKAAASSALDRLRNMQPAAAPVAPSAPAAPALDINALVAQAVAAAMSAVQEAHAKQMGELMAQNAALLNSATEAKTTAAAAQTETVTVTPKGAKGTQATK
jgi:hypothetical protein